MVRYRAVTVLLLIGGCSGQAVVEKDSGAVAALPVRDGSVIRSPALFACGDREVSLQYGGDSVVAVIDGQRALLRHSPGDSIGRYASMADSVVVWRQGNVTAITVRGAELTDCVEQSAQPFVARGHEPGWVLRLVDDHITYIGSYGADTATGVVSSVQTNGPATTYTVTSPSRLTVVVRDEPCGDGATGMPHPYSVTVTHDSLTVNGCGGEPSSLLVGQEWVVSTVAGTAMAQSAPTMNFSRSGRVFGSTSCNRYAGPYMLGGEGLTFGAMAATKMACAEPRMRQETQFLEALGRVTRFELTGDGSLRLLSEGGQAIVARRQ